MNRRSALVLLIATVLAVSCQGDHPGVQEAEFDCNPIGNLSAEFFCAITYTQLLANPHDYTGRKVFFHAWAVRAGNRVLLFPSADSANGGEGHASVIAHDGERYGDLVEYLGLYEELEPVRVKVGGTFLYNQMAGTSRSVLKGHDSFRFGQLADIGEFQK